MLCPRCNSENSDTAVFCTSCGVQMAMPAAAPVRPMEEDPAMRLLLPVGRSGWAIAAGYLGLFSVLLIFAPFALATGIIALIDIKRNPKKIGKGRAIFGIVMGSIFTALGVAVLVSVIVTRSI